MVVLFINLALDETSRIGNDASNYSKYISINLFSVKCICISFVKYPLFNLFGFNFLCFVMYYAQSSQVICHVINDDTITEG